MNWKIGVIIAVIYAAGMIWRAASFFAWKNKNAPDAPIDAARLVPDIMFWPYTSFKKYAAVSLIKGMKPEVLRMLAKEMIDIAEEKERRNDHV